MDRPLAHGWVTLELKDVARICDNLRQPINAEERSRRVGPYPYYGATGQVGWIDSYLMDGEYVLLGEDGAPFLDSTKSKAYIVAGKAWVNNHAHVLQAKSEVTTNRFLLHALNAVSYAGYVNGTTRLKLTQAAMRTIPILVPPLPEQHRIVAEIEKQFSRLDAGVAALKRSPAALKRYRCSVLQAACEGRLVPTEADLARQEGRDYEPADQLLARILEERRTRWEADQLTRMKAQGKTPKDDSWKAKYQEPARPVTAGLPDSPQGWAWASTAQLADKQGGIQKQPSRAPRQCRYPFLRVANVLRDRLDLSEIHRIELFPGELPRLRLRTGDLLIVEGNGSPSEIERMAVWNGAISDCVHQNHIIRARPAEGVIPQYIGSAWNSQAGTQRIRDVASSTSGLYTLSVSKIAKIVVPLPPTAEQHRIVAEVERRLSIVDSQQAAIDASLKRAERLRQSILKQAFKGKLVPQNPTDEPASMLLERIRREHGPRKRRTLQPPDRGHPSLAP